ncbi:DUF7661 family protein [Agaribacter marinus]|uniref:DUF7661 domain-containing protein n=1 Tax=Agaribacter marinus TaxID=1431249 RepID=A0AA37T113_9ALTE|nr:hypothetical protein [Agaribacter marinus]GLR71964.1 hypothetical protein GCM10007852_28720 [Agaribacter marinus]
MKFDVFGREVEVIQTSTGWAAFYLGNEGKKRIATDIKIPKEITENGLAEYLADLCHEWSTLRNNEVKLLSP